MLYSHVSPFRVIPHMENSQFPPSNWSIRRAATDLADRLPIETAPGGPGWNATAASLLEATARKPGNVHPTASFPDLHYADLVAAAQAIAPPLDEAGRRPLGQIIEAAVAASRAVSRSNANLGIVLAIAPLAAAGGHEQAATPATVRRVIADCTAADAAAIYRAIGIAGAGGLGRRARHDLSGPAPASIRAAMREAAEAVPADSIAALWAYGYESLWQGVVTDLAQLEEAGCGWEETMVRAAVAQLARTPDSLIARRHGLAAAENVSRRAATIESLSGPAWNDAVAAFDRALRGPPRLNPGTTADLIAAGLFIHLAQAGSS